MPSSSSIQEHRGRLQSRLVELAAGTPRLMSILRAVRELALPSWCVGAGAVRNLVWDALHGYAIPTALPDIDVVYFDDADLRRDRDVALQERLGETLPGVCWEVVNQAGVHLWYEEAFGYAVEPLHSLEEGVGSWPEFATCVGLRLNDDDSIAVIAPHGLDDLFAMVVRHNPARASLDAFRRRVAQKRFEVRWPKVKIRQTGGVVADDGESAASAGIDAGAT